MTDSARRALRLTTLVIVLVALFMVGRATGITHHLGPERVRDLVRGAGPWAYLVYAGTFAVGELVHIPGMLFVGAGILAFGKTAGFLMAFTGAVLSVSVTFLFVRGVAGQVFSESKHPFIKRILSHLDERPVRTVMLLRLLLWLMPAVNYALALSNVRFRDYFVGSTLGLFVPVLGAAVFFEWIFVRFAWLFH